MKKLTQACNMTKGKVFVVRSEDNTFQIKGPHTSTRLCAAKTLFTTPEYQAALTLARLWRLELTMQIMGCTPDNIQKTKRMYEEMDFGAIPQFSQMIRLVQP